MASKKSFDKNWEESVYKKGRQLNLYPYDLMVSIVARKFFHLEKQERKKIKVLDLGCGAGNNAKFLAESGFDFYGIDGSESALSFCQNIFKKNNLRGNFLLGDFLNLPYNNNFFDLIIDRESLYANRYQDIEKIIRQVYEKLKPGGYFISFAFAFSHPDKKFGKKLEINTYEDFTEGSFYKTGKAHFTTVKEIVKLFSQFKIENIKMHSLRELYKKAEKSMEFDEYIIISKKP